MQNLLEVAVAAEALRSYAGQVVPPFSTYRILAATWPSAVVTGRCLPAGVDEVVSISEDGPLLIYSRRLSSCDRRFAMAHAMAHLLFDFGARPVGGVVIEPARERRADAFARELLVPDLALLRRVTRWPSRGGRRCAYLDQVDEIASAYHAPGRVIDERIRQLDCLGVLVSEFALTQ